MISFYDRVRDACSSRGTTITAVLKSLGKSTGITGSWKAGTSPHLDTVVAIAELLGMSLDELVYGRSSSALSQEQSEWLSLINNVPADQQAILKSLIASMASAPSTEKESTLVS